MNIYRLTGFLVATLFTYFSIHQCRSLYHGDVGEITMASSGYKPFVPAGMIIIPSGTFLVGSNSNYETPYNTFDKSKRVSMSSFFMDSTPVTVRVYREFIADLQREGGFTGEESEENFEEINEEEPQSTVVEEESLEEESENPEVSKQTKSKKNNKEENTKITLQYINKVKPDPNAWNVFPHFISENYPKHYFTHKRFDKYPIVCITWYAANEFCKWRTRILNNYRLSKRQPPTPAFELLAPSQLEYAMKGGIPAAKYPWGNAQRDKNGKPLANVKMLPGDYVESGYTLTSPVKSFPPNAYGAFFEGNVWEWTSGAKYDGPLMKDIGELNSDYIDDDQPYKVVMGIGAFNTPLYTIGTREIRHGNKPSANIGFRCAMDNFAEQPNVKVIEKEGE